MVTITETKIGFRVCSRRNLIQDKENQFHVKNLTLSKFWSGKFL